MHANTPIAVIALRVAGFLAYCGLYWLMPDRTLAATAGAALYGLLLEMRAERAERPERTER